MLDYCEVRRDLIEDGLLVPTGTGGYLSGGVFEVIECRDSGEFNLTIRDSFMRMHDVMSIDFDFI